MRHALRLAILALIFAFFGPTDIVVHEGGTPAALANGDNAQDVQAKRMREHRRIMRLRYAKARQRAIRDGRATNGAGDFYRTQGFDPDQLEDINLTLGDLQIMTGWVDALDRQLDDIDYEQDEYLKAASATQTQADHDRAKDRLALRRRLQRQRDQVNEERRQDADALIETYGLDGFNRMLPGANFNGRDTNRSLSRQPCTSSACGIYALSTVCCDNGDRDKLVDPAVMVAEAEKSGFLGSRGMSAEGIAAFARQSLKMRKTRAKRFPGREGARKALNLMRKFGNEDPPRAIVARIRFGPRFVDLDPDKFKENPQSVGNNGGHFVSAVIGRDPETQEERVFIGDPLGYRFDVDPATFLTYFGSWMVVPGS